MIQDARYGLRMLLKNPAFAMMAVLALALGIGANTAIFSVVNAVLLQRLPFEDPDRLVIVWEQSPRTGKTNVVNPINFLEWRARNHSFQRIAALVPTQLSLTGDGEPERVDGMLVSNGFFEILGIKPIAGRWFTPQEDVRGNDSVAIVAEGLWRRRYAADPLIVGREIRVNNHNVVVVGVLPSGFRFPFTRAELWVPMAIDPARAAKTGRYMVTVARLKPGATVASAQADMNVIAAQLEKERPDFDARWGITVVGLREQVVGDVRTPLLILLGAVGLVLLIACANVANLMLMKAAGRRREIAIRAALGAGGTRIVRQLLVESTLIALLGGILGIVIGLWAMALLVAALPDSIAYANLKTIRIDRTVFLFTSAVSFLTGIMFGLAPALKAGRANIQESLRDGARGGTGRGLTRSMLVTAEVALSIILLTGAGLLVRSFAKLASVDPGFDARHVLSMQLATAGRFDTTDRLLEFNQALLQRVRTLPGVEAAGISHYLPLGRLLSATGFWRADRPRPGSGEEPVTQVLVVMPGYFSAMNIPLIRGRVFDDSDRRGAPWAVVINQMLARQFYPGEDPVGKHLCIQWGHPDDTYEIVGVVGDVRQTALAQDAKPGLFISNLQEPTGPTFLVVRAPGNPKRLTESIRAEVRALDREMPVSDVRTMDEYVSDSVAAPRFNTILLGSFAGLALLLAAVGIFGVVSSSVTERTREIGVRRALGAGRGKVVREVLAQGLRLTALGAAIGMAGAFGLTRFLEGLLFGVTPDDATTFVAVPLVLVGVAMLASWLPARRAARVDPMIALRCE